MPGVIGVVDGTHIHIKKPENDVESIYYAVRKAAHTKNVQVVRNLKYNTIQKILHNVDCEYHFRYLILTSRL